MKIRDRIRELRRVKASELIPNPKNWRTHPEAQKNVMQGLLAEIGYADALLAREREDGSLLLLDGHLRAETTPDQEVPVLILDVSQEEADKILATLDPLAAMAGKNDDLLAELIEGIHTESAAVRDLLAQTLSAEQQQAKCSKVLNPKEVIVPEIFQVIVECSDESDQQRVYEKLTSEGFSCRLLNL